MSKDEKFDRADVIVSTRWRFTSAPTTVAGLHASVLLGFPAMLAALPLGVWRPVVCVWLAYMGFVFYLNSKWKITPFEWVRMLFTRFVKGNKWLVR